jgi:hypothetical protein
LLSGLLKTRSRARALAEIRGPAEFALLLRIGTFAATVPALMRMPLPRAAALVTRPPRRRSPEDAEIEQLDRLIALAPRIAAPMVKGGCLTRGVTLFWFARRAGLDVELRFGLDPSGHDDTDGHCWLTLEGEPFLEKQDPRPRFAETYRWPLPI